MCNDFLVLLASAFLTTFVAGTVESTYQVDPVSGQSVPEWQFACLVICFAASIGVTLAGVFKATLALRDRGDSWWWVYGMLWLLLLYFLRSPDDGLREGAILILIGLVGSVIAVSIFFAVI